MADFYITTILILAVLLMLICIALLYFVSSEKKSGQKDRAFRSDSQAERTTGKLDSETEFEEDQTESQLFDEPIDKIGNNQAYPFYELQSIIFIHTDNIIE